jgi:Pyridoxamine 5'-phosphate oxidase
MPKLTPEQVREFLARPDVDCHLACLDDDGAPYMVPIWFLYEDDAFYVWARARSQWGEHLERDGRVALCIDGGEADDEWNKRVLARGQAELIFGPGRVPDNPEHPIRQLLYRTARRIDPELTFADFAAWSAETEDVGYRVFRVQPSNLTSWWGEYAKRYRSAYPSPVW